jgi:hypothetical protein
MQVQYHSHPQALDVGRWTLAFSTFEEKEIDDLDLEVAISRIEPPLHPPLDHSLVGKATTKSGAMRGFVVAASESMIVLSCKWNDLYRCKFKFDSDFVVELDGTMRIVTADGSEKTKERKATFAGSIPEYRDLAAQFQETEEAWEAAEWGTTECKELERKWKELKSRLESVPVPAALGSTMPLTLNRSPHCELRGIELAILRPLYGCFHFVQVVARAPAILRQ